MAYKNLKQFIKALQKAQELAVIEAEVDSNLEITEIVDRVSKQAGKALLFKKVKGGPYPVLINAFGSVKRMALSLGVTDFDQIAHQLEQTLKISNYLSVKKMVKSIPNLLRLALSLPLKLPFWLGNPPCQQVIEEPNLDTIPILKCWPFDGGRFMTMSLIFTKDPMTGRQNIGLYRLQVYDPKTAGMHWQKHKDGASIFCKYKELGYKKMPVSVVIGADPATIFASALPLPDTIDEILFAGYLRGRPVPMVKSLTNPIYVPAHSEFVLEGYVDTEELITEGPFGDHTSYYSQSDLYPVFHIEKISHQKKAIYNATIVGQPPMEDCYMGVATEHIFLPLMKMLFSEVVKFHCPFEGGFSNCIIMAIDKQYPHHAKKMMNSVWGYGQMLYTKMVIVVDKEVDPYKTAQVARAIFENLLDLKRDFVFSEGPVDALDHSSTHPLMGYRLGIDATRKWAEEKYTQRSLILSPAPCSLTAIKVLSPAIINLKFTFTEKDMASFLLIISVDKEIESVASLIKKLWEQEVLQATNLILVDRHIDSSDFSKVAWELFNNIDAGRDITLDQNRFAIDATQKGPAEGYYRTWPQEIEMDEKIKEQVTRRWAEYGID